MKKFLLLATTLFIVERSSAQISIAPEVGVLMANLNSSSADSVFSDNTDYKLGYRLGLNLAVDIRKISIHAGAFYTARGSKSDVLGLKATVNTNYIDIPVYVNYNIINKLGNQLFIGVGPYFSYCTGAKMQVKGSILGFNVDDKQDLNVGSSSTDQIRSIDYGANANVGFVTSLGIYARLSYSLGLANIANTSDGSVRSNGFALSVGYQIKL